MTEEIKKPHTRLKILVLSPHRDDAAFSVALSIGAWLRNGHTVTIMNAFTRSVYAPFSDADSVHENDRMSYVSAMRKREDESFLRRVPGAKMVDLNIKDAPLRLHCSAEVVCEMPVDPNDGAFVKIRKGVGKFTGLPHTALVLPLALGNHVDHRVVRDAVLPLTGDLPVAFYEDLPYAARDGVIADLERFREDTGGAYQQKLEPVVCRHAANIAWKRGVALGYTSQIAEDEAERLSEFANRYQGNERLWANEAFIRLAGAETL